MRSKHAKSYFYCSPLTQNIRCNKVKEMKYGTQEGHEILLQQLVLLKDMHALTYYLSTTSKYAIKHQQHIHSPITNQLGNQLTTSNLNSS